MIKSIEIENLKGFQKYKIEFDRINLLVGGNNCGKTSVFHALNVFFWCVHQTADIQEDSVVFRKTQLPDLGAIPYFNTRDIFYKQKTRTGRQPTKIKVTLKTTVSPDLTFTIYPAFSRNLMIDGSDQTITKAQYNALTQLDPIYVPGTIGITVREELYREVAQERMILEGRQNQVLRNLVYRLKKKPEEWHDFTNMINPLFALNGIDVPFDELSDEWLTATYFDGECKFDFVSAGSGFLQIINLLSFLFLHSSRVALLDEPDSHMHDDLQRLTFDLLDKLSQKRNVQIIVATHSPTLIDAAGLERVLVIDRSFEMPLRAQNVEKLVPLLGDRGLALPPAKVMNTLKTRRALFIEGKESDFETFLLEVGEILFPNFKAITRGLTIFETGGATKQWPFEAIEGFQQLLGTELSYIYITDRDFRTDNEMTEVIARANRENKSIAVLERRNRESYLLLPRTLADVLRIKWRNKHRDAEIPVNCSDAGIKDFILQRARELEDETQSKFDLEHEHVMRQYNDRQDRLNLATTHKLYFRTAYTDVLQNNEIPYKLLDSKQILRDLRTHISQQHQISFSDTDILKCMIPEDITNDLRAVVQKILALFPAPIVIPDIREPEEPQLPYPDIE